MPDEIGTEATRPDAPSADDALFGDSADKADDTAATVAEEQDTQGSDATGEPAVAEEQDADKEGAQDGPGYRRRRGSWRGGGRSIG